MIWWRSQFRQPGQNFYEQGAQTMKHSFARPNQFVFVLLCLFALMTFSLFSGGYIKSDSSRQQTDLQRASLTSGPPSEAEHLRARSYTIIVKFVVDDALAEILALYRPHRDRAVREFAIWAQDKPELRGLTLDRVTYSGEALLSYNPGMDSREPRLTPDEIIAQLNASPFVRYAELDSIVQAQSE